MLDLLVQLSSVKRRTWITWSVTPSTNTNLRGLNSLNLPNLPTGCPTGSDAPQYTEALKPLTHLLVSADIHHQQTTNPPSGLGTGAGPPVDPFNIRTVLLGRSCIDANTSCWSEMTEQELLLIKLETADFPGFSYVFSSNSFSRPTNANFQLCSGEGSAGGRFRHHRELDLFCPCELTSAGG